MRYVSNSLWDKHVANFEDISCEQTSAFAVNRWGHERTRFAIFEYHGKVIAGACIVVFQVPVLGRGVAYVKFGPVWRHRHYLHSMETYQHVVRLLQTSLAHEEGHALVIVPRPHPEMLGFEQTELLAAGFELASQNRDPNRYFVNLSMDKESQLKNLGQKWRYNLKRANKNNLQVHRVEVGDAEKIFESLHSEMASRKKFHSTDPISAISEMMSSLPKKFKPTIFLAESEGQPVAGAVIMNCGDVAYYLFGASNEKALPLRAGYALQWEIIQFLKERDAKWYDLGGEAGTQGLRQFKKGLTGKNGVVLETPGELFYCADPVSAAIRRVVVTARDSVRRLRNVQMKT